eukprot:TRINITY_DN121361_c0_g1_i1.p1 TRINITY_DN121361_c0_g1~~TRINITY_DN121361_c0_g1_i1.p1  ORF type:complete len:286 (-),score=16.83 TRINITY_DN121361_c0_g1_i1:581-1438(-)
MSHSSSSPLRQLFSEGFGEWDYYWGGIITDYVLGLVCVVLFALTLVSCRQKDKPPPVTRNLQIALLGFTASTFVSYGIGGISHHILNGLHSQGEVMGQRWGDEHSEWMIPWAMGFVGGSFSASFFLSIIFAAMSFSRWIHVPCLLLAFCVSVCEAYLLFGTDVGFDMSGYIAGLWGVVSAFISTTVLVVDQFTTKSAGALLLVAALAQLCTYVFRGVGVPASCTESGEARAGCPYPMEFNQNAIFHVLLTIAALVTSLAVWRQISTAASRRGAAAVPSAAKIMAL